MKISELVDELKGVLEAHGDIELYVGGGMKPLTIEVVEAIDAEQYGQHYVFIEVE